MTKYLAIAFLITGFLVGDAYGEEDEVYYCAGVAGTGFTGAVLHFSESIRTWYEKDEKVFFDDFDDQNVSAKIRLLKGFPEYFSDTFHNTLHGLKKLG